MDFFNHLNSLLYKRYLTNPQAGKSWKITRTDFFVLIGFSTHVQFYLRLRHNSPKSDEILRFPPIRLQISTASYFQNCLVSVDFASINVFWNKVQMFLITFTLLGPKTPTGNLFHCLPVIVKCKQNMFTFWVSLSKPIGYHCQANKMFCIMYVYNWSCNKPCAPSVDRSGTVTRIKAQL